MGTIYYSNSGHELTEHETHTSPVFRDGMSGDGLTACYRASGVLAPSSDWTERDPGDVVGFRAICSCGWASHTLPLDADDHRTKHAEDPSPYAEGYCDGLARAHVQPLLDWLDQT